MYELVLRAGLPHVRLDGYSVCMARHVCARVTLEDGATQNSHFIHTRDRSRKYAKFRSRISARKGTRYMYTDLGARKDEGATHAIFRVFGLAHRSDGGGGGDRGSDSSHGGTIVVNCIITRPRGRGPPSGRPPGSANVSKLNAEVPLRVVLVHNEQMLRWW